MDDPHPVRLVRPRFEKGETALLVVGLTDRVIPYIGQLCTVTDVGPWAVYVPGPSGTLEQKQSDYLVKFGDGVYCYLRDWQLRKLSCAPEPEAMIKHKGDDR